MRSETNCQREGDQGTERAGSAIDRWEPRRRPARSPAGSQSWRRLLFLHWEVDAALLRKLVPQPFELDLFDGRAYVGLVPFEMANVRSRHWPGRLARDFGETNVRTYVTCYGRPGVYFFSLDASSLHAVLGARIGWGLPYFWAQIRLVRRGNEISYAVQRRRGPGSLEVHYRVDSETTFAGTPAQLALADFLLERYLLFVVNRGRIYEGQVHHRPYPVGMATVVSLRQDLLEAAGLRGLRSEPDLVHWSAGVDVEIFPLRRVGPPVSTA